jgi:hypothetical protein
MNILPLFLEERLHVFIDESSYNIHYGPEYVWSPKGKPARIRRPPKSRNLSLISAISKRGLERFQIC